MKKINLIILMMIGIFSYAQNGESTYLQQEHDRLARVNIHEANIQNYINQNISSYNLPLATTSKITTQKHEDGSSLTANELNEMVSNVKKQNLREAYFALNPTTQNDYSATSLAIPTACVNNGFENGDTTGFSFYSQKFISNWEIYKNIPSLSVSPQNNSIVSVVDNSQTDEKVPSLSRVKSGNYAIRLNNGMDGNYDVSSMKRQVVIGSDQEFLTFFYALVLEDGNHGSTGNPYYQCNLYNASGVRIDFSEIVADRNNTDVFKVAQNGAIVYTDWVCQNFDVSQYRGQTLTLEIIMGDCGFSGHWGYGYFDDFCGVKCSAPAFGKIVLDPLGITCPLLPLRVSGNFIAPTGRELEKLTLQVKNSSNGSLVYEDLGGNYNLFENEFSFNVSANNLFSDGIYNKQIDFYVTGKFKLIGGTSYTSIVSQSANDGPDATFTNNCKICDACGAPTTTYRFIGMFSNTITNHAGWVKYIDKYGNEQTANIGYTEDGCQGINAVSIVSSRFVQECNE